MTSGYCSARDGQGFETLLGLGGEVEEDHSHDIARGAAAGAGYRHARARDLLAIHRGAEVHRHLGPGRDGGRGKEFDAVFAKVNRLGIEGDAGSRGTQGHRLKYA